MSLRILFWGTEENGAPFLSGLLSNGKHHVTAVVVSSQKKVRGWGPRAWLSRMLRVWRRISPPKDTTSWIARRAGLRVWDRSINVPSFADFVLRLKPDLFVVASFSRILKPETLALAPRGVINLHPSLLPKYRGADPIFWVLVNNEKETGVTVHWIDEGVDTGALLGQKVVSIYENEDSISLARRLTQAGVELLAEVLDQINGGRAVSVSQNEASASYFPPASEKYRTIHWEDGAESISRLVRASASFGGATAMIEGRVVKVIKSEVIARAPHAVPGKVLDRKNSGAEIVCKDALLDLMFAGGSS
jgi:methionyl-tRNA formyltransferase